MNRLDMQTIIKDRSNKIVVALEKKQRIDADKPDRVEKIKHIAETDDSQGYDILFFDEDGPERQIEIKATSMLGFYNGFFLSSNELEKSKAFRNYYLYLAASAMSGKPVLSMIKKPEYSDKLYFSLSPTLYNVRINNREVEA